MLKKTLLTVIKDKKKRLFYESILNMLFFIQETHTQSDLNLIQKELLAFKNGYTNKLKIYKNLRKAQAIKKDLNIDLFILFSKQRQFYLENTSLKRFDDLIRYAYEQSLIGFFFLISINSPDKSIQFFQELSSCDILSNICLEDKDKLYPIIVSIPNQMLEDYAVEYSIEGKIMVNENYLYLLDYLYKKIKIHANYLTLNLSQYDENISIILNSYINYQLQELNNYFKKLYKQK